MSNVELWKTTDQESAEVQDSSFRAPLAMYTEIGYWCLCFGHTRRTHVPTSFHPAFVYNVLCVSYS